MSDFDYRGMRKAILASALKPNPRLVLLILVEYMPTAYPGKAKLRDETGLSVASIKRSLLDLERMGILVVDRSKASTGRDSNTIVMAADWKSKLPVRGALREPRIRQNPVSDRTPPGVCETSPGVHSEPTPGVCVNPKAGIQAGTKQTEKKNCATAAPPAPARAPGFVLESPKAKPKSEPKPEHQAVIAHWIESYERYRGEKPILSDVDTRDVKRLLNGLKRNGARACELIDNAFTDEFFQRTGTIGRIASHPSSYQQPYKAPASTRKTAAPQMGMADDVASDESGFDDRPPSGSKVVPIRKAAGQ